MKNDAVQTFGANQNGRPSAISGNRRERERGAQKVSATPQPRPETPLKRNNNRISERCFENVKIYGRFEESFSPLLKRTPETTTRQ